MQPFLRFTPALFCILFLTFTWQDRKPQEKTPAVVHGLEWELGEWEGTRRSVASGEEDPLTMRVEAILDGAGQTREIEIVHSGGVYRGFAVQVYDSDQDLWRREYVNDVRRTFASLEGRVDDENGRSVWHSVTPGRSRESRLVSERPAPDHWVRTLSISEDGGATWSDLWVDSIDSIKREEN